MKPTLTIADLMQSSHVAFGTSGARGLVDDMTDRVCSAYTQGFLSHITKSYGAGTRVAIGGDHRPSTERILKAVTFGARQVGFQVDHLGRVPSPAVALYGFTHRCPTVMVTGSHIPADRNGMKYTTISGEFSKADEAAMRGEVVTPPDAFDERGQLRLAVTLDPVRDEGRSAYIQRYLDAFPRGYLAGLRLAVYGHSSVARDILFELYGELGATVIKEHYSEEFIPVDTEAIRPEDVALAREIAERSDIDAIVSTDGDADRPLIADENGQWFRGDVAGILTARFLGATGVACPVSCNTALERSESFAHIERTRIGSPYVIAGMEGLLTKGSPRVVGYEANGGFLTASPLSVPEGDVLPPLPTRDPVIVHLALLGAARRARIPLSALRQSLPSRHTGSDRDPSFATSRSLGLLAQLREMTAAELERSLGLGPLQSIDNTDGLRLTFESGEILHYRPSGNAPELRCYAEASSEKRATDLVRFGLERARSLAP